jgi:ArsR family transcriptional regulator, arsenate/arsenite/antimonite-responsive transcriptional repressor
LVDIFKALSEENRLRILSMILDGEMCVCSIEACLNMSQSNASRHLNVLKHCGILISYKKAQWTYYQINAKFITDHEELYNYLCIKLRGLPTYEIDQKNKEICHDMSICSLNINPH